jgi:hypothetical protein
MYKKHQVIAAEPNWFALDWSFTQTDSGVNVSKEPIVAWQVTINEERGKVWTDLNPVTQDDLSSFYEGAVLRPDGTVCVRGIEVFYKFEDYVADVRKRHHNNATSFMNKAEANYAANA